MFYKTLYRTYLDTLNNVAIMSCIVKTSLGTDWSAEQDYNVYQPAVEKQENY